MRKLQRVPNAVLAFIWSQDDLDAARNALLRNLQATKRFYDKLIGEQFDDPASPLQ